MDFLKGLTDTGTFIRAYLTLLWERGPTVALGIIIILVGVALFIASNKAVQAAVGGVATTVATRGGNIASKVVGK